MRASSHMVREEGGEAQRSVLPVVSAENVGGVLRREEGGGN